MPYTSTWETKTDGVDTINASDFNTEFENISDGINSIDTSKVSNTDYATSEEGGVVKIPTGNHGLVMSEGSLYIKKATEPLITAKENEYMPVVPKDIDFAIRAGLISNSKITQEDYESICNTIGAANADDVYTKEESDNRYLPQDKAIGEIATTEYAIEDNALNYDIYGNSVQNGTPTQTSPVEVQSVGDLVTSGEHQGQYKITNKVTGKNILKKQTSNCIHGGLTYTVDDDGVITISGTKSISDYSYMRLYNAGSDGYLDGFVGTLFLSGIPTNTLNIKILGHILKANGSNDYVNDNGSGVQITLAEGDRILYFEIRVQSAIGTVIPNIVVKPQLEINTIKTKFEPYRESVITTYLDAPLRKIENYADYISYKTQKHYKKIGVINSYNGESITTSYISTTGELSTGATVYYVLDTPTEQNITLEALPLQADINNISCTTAIHPSNIEVTYYQNPTKVINELRNAIVSLQSATE